ncbi:cytochrome c biogenesis protein CcdC [Paenalkalicoccus suaedae]|uniref:Cytochrome c biogenesis protein CcdC n=1 Tax=Paenalkalicoccus suaedae TaxID=2592382 RepID=A0A859FES6_9BACI|nr:cytochrome c biogenesis protein CcdC [Paenalkalicoccus suaedae]QKS71338.1 cytochrome c biogenesis protein CcdC [Paenalkalicoccus suaedae]
MEYSTFFMIAATLMAIMAIFVRMRAMKRPATARKILIPPIAMSTGFLMFFYPPVQAITALEVVESLTVGALFSILLIKTSSFEIRDNDVYMKRSKVFPFILVGLLIARIIFKLTFGINFEYEVLAGMFFLLAFGMILPWRIAMYRKFKAMETELHTTESHTLATAK